jgi:hypothetical protein
VCMRFTRRRSLLEALFHRSDKISAKEFQPENYREISRDGDQKNRRERMTGAPSMPSCAEGDAFNGSGKGCERAFLLPMLKESDRQKLFNKLKLQNGKNSPWPRATRRSLTNRSSTRCLCGDYLFRSDSGRDEAWATLRREVSAWNKCKESQNC